ncbi:MAG: hypothetical protein NC541_08080 [bacterium]|nr:hypothetical protein [bacterium]
MKKITKILLPLGIAVMLAGCGQANPAGNMEQNITLGSGSLENAAGDIAGGNGTQQEPEASNQEKDSAEEGVYSFVYENVTLTPGEIFDQTALGDPATVSEVPSCAFEGNDKMYNYEAFELTAYIEEDGERIYSIYFIDPNLPTTEGLCLGDTVEDMKSRYGENYAVEGSSYVYTRGDTLLSVVTQNDTIVGIEYRLNR